MSAAAPQFSLNPLLLWGLDIVRFVQGAENSGITFFMRFISNLAFCLVIAATMFFFWCVDEKRGTLFGILVVLSAWINSFLKVLLKQPRPFDFDPSLGMAFESSFGFPSGHSQMIFTLLVPLAYWAALRYKNKKVLIWTAAVFFILLTGLSRTYLGVHFPSDLAGGWLIGGVVTGLFFLACKYVLPLLASSGKRGQSIAAAAAALLLVFLYREDTGYAALLLGFASGRALMISDYPFSASVPAAAKIPAFLVRVLRFAIGIAGAAVIYFGLKIIFPGEGSVFGELPVWGASSPYADLARFIRYALLGLWTSAGAPFIFGNFGLAEIGGKFRGGDED